MASPVGDDAIKINLNFEFVSFEREKEVRFFEDVPTNRSSSAQSSPTVHFHSERTMTSIGKLSTDVDLRGPENRLLLFLFQLVGARVETREKRLTNQPVELCKDVETL